MVFAVTYVMVVIRHLRGCALTAGLFLSLLLIAMVVPAQAYTDPGSGLLLWQLIVSGFVGSVVFRWRKALRSIFKRDRKQKEP